MKKQLGNFYKLLILLGFCFYSNSGLAISKEAVMDYILVHQKENSARLRDLNEHIQAAIDQNYQISLKLQTPDSQEMEERLSLIQTKIHNLVEQQKEHLLREEFFNLMIFHLQNFGGGSLKGYLHSNIPRMTKLDAVSGAGRPSMITFLNNLGLAIRQLPERNEDILAFIIGYMKFSSIRKPIPPHRYVDMRNYINGKDSVRAEPATRENIGDLVEAQLDQLEQQNNHQEVPQAKPTAINLRPSQKPAPTLIENPVQVPARFPHPKKDPAPLPAKATAPQPNPTNQLKDI